MKVFQIQCPSHSPPPTECLFSAAPEVVRSYGWEPTEVFDTIAAGWGNVASLAISSSQLIGVTYSQSRYHEKLTAVLSWFDLCPL